MICIRAKLTSVASFPPPDTWAPHIFMKLSRLIDKISDKSYDQYPSKPKFEIQLTVKIIISKYTQH